MKTKALAVFITIMSIALLTGCKKDSLPDKVDQEQTDSFQNLKNWFESETNSTASGTTANKDIRTGTPVWQGTKYYPESQTYITPIKLGAKSTEMNNSLYKFLLATGDPKGGITAGNYVYLFPDKNNKMDISNIDQNLLPDFFSLQQIPAGFTGTIIKYDLDYSIVFSKNLEKGKMTNSTKKMTTGQSGIYKDMNDITPNSALPCQYCVDYYLVTYDGLGNIINIEYLYTVCGDCSGEGNGNGGGNGVPTCVMTAAQADAALNSINCITTNSGNGMIGTPGPPDQNGIIRAPKPCSGGGFTLNILPGYSPHWEASYAGIVYKLDPADTWKWESLIYTGFPQTSGEFPPCVSANTTASGVSCVISADKLKATTAGNYSSQVSWTCINTTRIKSFSGPFSATFLAGNPVPVY